MKNVLTPTVTAVLAAVALSGMCHAKDLPTTYGEDPVPSTYRSLQPPFSAYGFGPIPDVSPLERWLDWRAYRESKKQMRPRRPMSPKSGGLFWWLRP